MGLITIQILLNINNPDFLQYFLAGGLSTTIIPKLETLNKEPKISGQISTIVAILFISLSLLISNAENF